MNNSHHLHGVGSSLEGPTKKKEAPAGRHGAISGDEIDVHYSAKQFEAMRFAFIALSTLELTEWMQAQGKMS